MAIKDNWTYCDGDGRLDQPKRQAMNRRQLFAGAASLVAGGVWWAGAKSAFAQATLRADRRNGNVFISVFLRGGADALNVVTPYAEDSYYKFRPSLAIANPKAGKAEREKLADLDGFFGLNPAMLSLLPDFREGTMAVIHAVGSYDSTHSHFQAMSTMELGLKNETGRVSGGWLARHLNASGSTGTPLRAVAFSGTMPDSLSGTTGALAISELAEYRLQRNDDDWMSDLRALYARGNDEMVSAGRETLQVLAMLNEFDPRAYKPEPNANYPDSQLGKAFREAAFLIKQDVGLEVCCLDSTGWDSHVTQGSTSGWLTELLADLANSITAFQNDLGKEMNRVTICVQSEFGRRVAENSGLGTDHGAGGCMLVFGGGVNGGKVYTDWPGLIPDKLTGPGDLPVTTDYRDVLAEIALKRLSTPSVNEIFPGLKHSSLGLIQA